MTDQILPAHNIYNLEGRWVNVRINETHLISGFLEIVEDGWHVVGEATFRDSEVASILILEPQTLKIEGLPDQEIEGGIFIHVQVDKDKE